MICNYAGPFGGLIDLLQPVNITAEDAPEIERLLAETQPRTLELQAAYQGACEAFDTLAQVKRTIDQQLMTAERAYNERALAGMQEAVDSPVCDHAAIAESLAGLERTASFLRMAADYVTHVQLPDAQEASLLALRDVRRSESLEASLLCAGTQAQMLERVNASFSGMGRMGFVSEHVESLKSIAETARQESVQADRYYEAFRSAREATRQLRLTGGISKAEAIASAVSMSKQNEDNNA